MIFQDIDIDLVLCSNNREPLDRNGVMRALEAIDELNICVCSSWLSYSHEARKSIPRTLLQIFYSEVPYRDGNKRKIRMHLKEPLPNQIDQPLCPLQIHWIENLRGYKTSFSNNKILKIEKEGDYPITYEFD